MDELVKMIHTYTPTRVLEKLTRMNGVQYTFDELMQSQYSKKAATRLHRTRLRRPLRDYRKTNGMIKDSRKRVPPDDSMMEFIEEIHSQHVASTVNAKINSMGNNKKQLIGRFANKIQRDLQKKQIQNIIKMSNELKNKTNAITYNNLNGNKAYVIGPNWNAGRRNMYSKQTIDKFQKTKREPLHVSRNEIERMLSFVRMNSNDRQAIFLEQLLQNNPNQEFFNMGRNVPSGYYSSPFTRRDFFHQEKLRLSNAVDKNYKGKYNLIKQYNKDPNSTIKEIANYYS